jgi:hypothetical protein
MADTATGPTEGGSVAGVAVAGPAATIPLEVVDGAALPSRSSVCLKPGGTLRDAEGRAWVLPRFFYEIPSWEAAREVALAPHFMLWEFMSVDVREAPALLEFPRYVPCAVALLAGPLEVLRQAAGRPVHIAANGGYRSPAHRETRYASTHCWGTAVNIYRIGDDYLWSRDQIQRYARLARESCAAFWVRPYGPGVGEADDHLHLDLGYATLVPREAGWVDVTAHGGTESRRKT